ncbi:glycosyltransferase family 4 protein [Anaerocolumna jejuensis]|uniref:glycosyltransferase family 4 protein n=1 Tax=Anaerocolumna jejuensis TaxID=259063 RepID=UPI003F7C1B35
MKIWLYNGCMKLLSKSGIGKAYEHQKSALEQKGIEYTSKFSRNFNIVQLNTIFPDSVLVALLAKLMRKRVIYYAHSTMEDFKNSFKGSNLLAGIFKKWIEFCYNLGDLIITPTEYSKQLLEEYAVSKKIIFLTNGIDLDFYQRDAESKATFREKYHFSKDDKIIISAGHYIERKGIEDFAELAARMPEYQFVWFGYTNLKLVPDKIRGIVETKLPNLHFPGYITSEELREAYSGSDLFLFLTHEETEGIVLLEALAMKIPLLIRDIPIYRNWLMDRKQVYKGTELAEFESLIHQIVQGQALSLAEEGYTVAKERSISNVGNVLLGIYIKLLHADNPGYEGMDNRIKPARIVRQ